MAIERVRRNGPYAPLSATYYQDDDIAEAGEAAELLYLRGLAFCAGRPSDGYMSDSTVARIVSIGLDQIQERADRLVKVGLWERVDGGYVIRAWLKWNKSAEELGQYRASDRDRKRSQTVTEGVRAEPEKPEIQDESASARTVERNPSGSGAESERSPDDPLRTGPEPDTTTEVNPLGRRSESDTHYTSLHSTSLHKEHTPPSAARTSATEPISLDAHRTRSPTRIRRTAQDVDKDPHFVAFWAAYPRKVDKGHARKAWLTKVNSGADPQDITNGAARYRDDPQRPTEPRFIPHPATWLNGERWSDETRTTRAARAAQAGGGSWWQN